MWPPLLDVSASLQNFVAGARSTYNGRFWFVQLIYFTSLLCAFMVLTETQKNYPMSCLSEDMYRVRRCSGSNYLFYANRSDLEDYDVLSFRSHYLHGRKNEIKYCPTGKCFYPASPGVTLYPTTVLLMALISFLPLVCQVWKDQFGHVLDRFVAMNGDDSRFSMYFSEVMVTQGKPKPFNRYVIAAGLWFVSHFINWAIFYGFYGLEPCTYMFNRVLNIIWGYKETNYMEVYFPSYYECISFITGPSGSVETEAILCTLPANELFKLCCEVYLWLSFLATCATISSTIQVVRLLSVKNRLQVMLPRISVKSKDDMAYVVKNVGLNEWLLMYKLTFIIPTKTMSAFIKYHKKVVVKDSKV